MTLADTLHGPVRPGRWRAPDPTQTLPQVHRTPSPSTESKVAGRSTSCRRADWTEPLAARNLLLGPQGLGSQVVMSDALRGDESDVRPDPSGSGWGRPAGSGPVGRFAPAKLRRSCCCAPSRRRRSRAGARGPGPHTYGPAGRPRDYSLGRGSCMREDPARVPVEICPEPMQVCPTLLLFAPTAGGIGRWRPNPRSANAAPTSVTAWLMIATGSPTSVTRRLTRATPTGRLRFRRDDLYADGLRAYRHRHV